MTDDILRRIANKRRARIGREGHALGAKVPRERSVPRVPFGREPCIICEIKRRSPSKGAIDTGLDPVAQAAKYREAGVRSISVLTEEDHFGGSLEDLMRVKAAFPDLSVLRKEFILDEEDLEISFRSGADAVLLIAALLDGDTLTRLHARALALGLEPLVEIHTESDAAKARSFAPALTGINCRDLTTFRIDPLLPLERRRFVDWPTRLIYESGIEHPDGVRLARAAGFSGVLIGETAVRHPERLPGLVAAAGGTAPGGAAAAGSGPAAGDAASGGSVPAGVMAANGEQTSRSDSDRPRLFWSDLAEKRVAHPGRPLIKICGITCEEDLLEADRLGADLVGFVFASSPRRADPERVERFPATRALKVAVVVPDEYPGTLPPGLAELLDAGKIDAVQFHGGGPGLDYGAIAYPWYGAVRVGGEEDLQAAGSFRSPRVLIDARVAGRAGGTGKRVESELVRRAWEARPLWLAGGLDADNAVEAVREFAPELIDLSSGLESEPGRKDHGKLRQLFARMAEIGEEHG